MDVPARDYRGATFFIKGSGAGHDVVADALARQWRNQLSTPQLAGLGRPGFTSHRVRTSEISGAFALVVASIERCVADAALLALLDAADARTRSISLLDWEVPGSQSR